MHKRQKIKSKSLAKAKVKEFTLNFCDLERRIMEV